MIILMFITMIIWTAVRVWWRLQLAQDMSSQIELMNISPYWSWTKSGETQWDSEAVALGVCFPSNVHTNGFLFVWIWGKDSWPCKYPCSQWTKGLLPQLEMLLCLWKAWIMQSCHTSRAQVIRNPPKPDVLTPLTEWSTFLVPSKSQITKFFIKI